MYIYSNLAIHFHRSLDVIVVVFVIVIAIAIQVPLNIATVIHIPTDRFRRHRLGRGNAGDNSITNTGAGDNGDVGLLLTLVHIVNVFVDGQVLCIVDQAAQVGAAPAPGLAGKMVKKLVGNVCSNSW
jgi:hypothetical protein